MKNLRNFYLILGLFALAFALLAKHIQGVTITDFVLGFFHGLAITALVAGAITAAIPYLYRNRKPEHKPEPEPKEAVHPLSGHSSASDVN
jgi:hypothetical protein